MVVQQAFIAASLLCVKLAVGKWSQVRGFAQQENPRQMAPTSVLISEALGASQNEAHAYLDLDDYSPSRKGGALGPSSCYASLWPCAGS